MAVTVRARLVLPSFANNLRRCHSTMHERNSSAPIVADLAALDELEIRSGSSSARTGVAASVLLRADRREVPEEPVAGGQQPVGLEQPGPCGSG